jgi:hypothetical protein
MARAADHNRASSNGIDQCARGHGATGFTLLMTCEFVLGLALGTSPRHWLADLTSPPGAAGLAGQIVFGCLPLLVGRRMVRAG